MKVHLLVMPVHCCSERLLFVVGVYKSYSSLNVKGFDGY